MSKKKNKRRSKTEPWRGGRIREKAQEKKPVN